MASRQSPTGYSLVAHRRRGLYRFRVRLEPRATGPFLGSPDYRCETRQLTAERAPEAGDFCAIRPNGCTTWRTQPRNSATGRSSGLLTAVIGSGPKSADDMTLANRLERRFSAFWRANRTKRRSARSGWPIAGSEKFRRSWRPTPTSCARSRSSPPSRSAIRSTAGRTTTAKTAPPSSASEPASSPRLRAPPSSSTRRSGPDAESDGVQTRPRRARRRTELEPGESADMVDETGFGFYYQPNFNPGIQDLYDRRDQMGVRTFVNTIETIGNPANADVHLGSFYHLAFAKLTDTITESERLDYSRAIFFQGMEGYDDIRPGYTKVAVGSRRRRRCGFLRGLRDRNGELRHGDGGRRLEVDDVTADPRRSPRPSSAVSARDTSPTPLSSTARSECMPARMSIASRTDSSGHARSLPTAVRKPCSKTRAF